MSTYSPQKVSTTTSTMQTTYSLNLHHKQKYGPFLYVLIAWLLMGSKISCCLIEFKPSEWQTTKKKQKFPDYKKGCLNWNTWSKQKLSENQEVGELYLFEIWFTLSKNLQFFLHVTGLQVITSLSIPLWERSTNNKLN